MFILRTKYYLIWSHLLDLTGVCTNDFQKNLWNTSLKNPNKIMVSQTTQLAELVMVQQKWHIFKKNLRIVCNYFHCNHLSTASRYKPGIHFSKFYFLQPFKILTHFFKHSYTASLRSKSFRRWNSDNCKFCFQPHLEHP